MIKPRICIIGFGNIGCRHAQSFLRKKENFEITIVEPDDEVYLSNFKKIEGHASVFKRLKQCNELNEFYDLIVISTVSNIRLEIIENLNKDLFNNCLVEKIVFQSIDEFVKFDHLNQKYSNKYYVNFVNRYFPTNERLKSICDQQFLLTLEVFGGNFNFGSNGVHYIDLFEYITNESGKYYSGTMNQSQIVGKRGKNYKNYSGNAIFRTKSGHQLFVSTNSELCSGNAYLKYKLGNKEYIIDETESLIYESQQTGSLNPSKYTIIPSSKLTYNIYKDIIANQCRLPTIMDSYNCHMQHFNALNSGELPIEKYNQKFPVT